MNNLRAKILLKCKSKTFNGVPLKPELLCHMLEYYVKCLNEGNLLIIQ